MKFIISRQELSESTNRMQNIIATKTPLPILANILVEAKGDTITLMATDLTVGVRTTIPAQVIEEGSTTIPARRFVQLIKEITVPQIEISSNERNIITILAETSSFKLHGIAKTDYPQFQDVRGETVVRLKQKELREMFFNTAFAVARDDNRYALTGVYLSIQKGIALFAGTDGKRLARAYVTVDVDPKFTSESIIPLKAVDEISKNLTRDDEEVYLHIFPDKFGVEVGSTYILTKLLAGDYPNIDKVIPKNSTIHVQLHRDELSHLLRQVCLFTTEEHASVRFSFYKRELSLSINATDVGEGLVSMPVDYDGDKFDIAFNPKSFLDVLCHSKEEQVCLGLSDPFNPGVVVEGEGKVTEDHFPSPVFLVMPMRLSGSNV